MPKQDIKIHWSKKEEDLQFSWTGHTYDDEGNITREGGTKATAGLIAGHLGIIKCVYGNTLTEELEKRGYDLTTLKFSISRKETPK